MNWNYYWWLISPILGGLAGATVLAFARTYITELARHLATKHDLEDIQKQLAASTAIQSYVSERAKRLATMADLGEIQKQLQENTEITKSIDQKFSTEDYLARAELSFREKQLAEFYGPAYGTLKSQKRIYDLWMEGKMTDVNFEVKKLLSRQNAFLRQLIIDKAHLIEGSEMPKSFVHLVTSTLIFDLYAAPTDKGQIPSHLAKLDDVKFPNEFLKHVVDITEEIKARIEALHKAYAYKFIPSAHEAIGSEVEQR